MRGKYHLHAVMLEDTTTHIMAIRDELETLRERLATVREAVRLHVEASRRAREQRAKSASSR